MTARFNIRAADPADVARLQGALGLPRFIAATLVARGLKDPVQTQRFLEPSLDTDWLDPYLIPGLAEVVDALEGAIRRGGRIVVFGDFDVDGLSATAVLTRALRALGACALPFIPKRFEEGYGITEAALERVYQLKPDFLVSVDCGIACAAEVELLKARGIGVVITDHHEPADLVPQGVPVADPKTDPSCESSILAGVGVALKVVQALGARFGYPHLWRNYTDLAALGTVADLMPMLGENRALVADGLARINKSPRPCILALKESTGAQSEPVNSTNLSFTLIPRLNAAGRMGDAQQALDLLLCDKHPEAVRKAQQLEAINDERRSIEAELSELAKAQASQVYRDQRVLVVSGEGWHEGVKGIVASRLVGIYGVPCLLFSIEGNEARGSGRSVGQINLFKAVESCSDILIRFGGHEAAVGVTLPADKLPEFTQRMCEYMDALPEDSFHPLIEIDACVDLAELTLENVKKLELLAPFGQEMKTPCYLARDVSLTNCRAVGAEKNHLSCTLSNGRANVAGIMFHCNNIKALMYSDAVVNAAFEVQIDTWRGRRSVKTLLKSLAPARTCAALEACLDPNNLSFVADLYAASDTELCADVSCAAKDLDAAETARLENRAFWEKKAKEDPAGLQSAIIRALIGERPLHESQREALKALQAGRGVLAVMATGRGKSLIFHVDAACLALTTHQASVFVYPLRALIADQAFHLSEALESFGISVMVLTGESTPEERHEVFSALHEGSCDIVLTTPEFLSFHIDTFARSGRIGFVVVDEAHHIGQAKAGQRPVYANMGQVLGHLGAVRVLALTATAPSEVARDIRRTLPIDQCIFDETSRPNLQLEDQRNLKKRNDYLVSLVASGEKTVVFVNSRERSVALARQLRKRVPQLAPLIGFYNAGLSRTERTRVEDLFRTDALSVLVATSAFGEGVDIPNIRHVVLYHMPFNEVEFNQMSGRAGRDGKPAWIHLLFSRSDAQVNEGILADMTPSHNCLARVYRSLRALQRQSGDDFFVFRDEEVASLASKNAAEVRPSAVACGIAVFRELGLVETRKSFSSGEEVHFVRVLDVQSKVELTDSVRYREGLDEQEIYQEFKDWVMSADTATLARRVSHPLLPKDGTDEGCTPGAACGGRK